jgi:hypothetical protein
MAVMGMRKMRSCNLSNTVAFDATCLYCKLSHPISYRVASGTTQATHTFLMSQPQSPSSEHLSSLLDVHDDDPQQRSAISDTARQERLAALERRQNRSTTDPQDDTATAAKEDPQPFDANHAKRTEFRRLADPGIMRPNSKEVALRSLRVNLKSFVPTSPSFFFLQFFYNFFSSTFTSRPLPAFNCHVDAIYNRRESASRA